MVKTAQNWALEILENNHMDNMSGVISCLGDPRGSPDVFLMDISLIFLSWHANNNPFYMAMSLSVLATCYVIM